MRFDRHGIATRSICILEMLKGEVRAHQLGKRGLKKKIYIYIYKLMMTIAPLDGMCALRSDVGQDAQTFF